ncbi:MAG: hypothetical protein WHV66_11650, partial [Anaerolineales bacterium]
VAASSDRNPSLWKPDEHTKIQAQFERYLTLAEKTFSAAGLIDLGKYLWQRALLSFGDYLLPRGRNHSFLVNTVTDETSWKRLLRGTGTITPEPRGFLKQLWDKLSPNEDLAPQLESIIKNVKEIESWREELIHCPEAFEYCEKKFVRKYTSHVFYLLRTTQLNGYHAELFTYCLYIKLLKRQKNIFKLLEMNYFDVMVEYMEPCLQLRGIFRGNNVMFSVYSDNGGYRIQIAKTEFSEAASFEDILKTNGYSEKNNFLQLWSNRSDIEAHLKALDEIINSG